MKKFDLSTLASGNDHLTLDKFSIYINNMMDLTIESIVDPDVGIDILSDLIDIKDLLVKYAESRPTK